MKVRELRIILTVENLQETIEFYKNAMGLETSKEWHEAGGNGIIFDAGRASLELIDAKHKERIDDIEVGKQVAGPVRLAFNVGNDIENTASNLENAGATSLAAVKQAPWSKVIRMQDPSGMQFTLFETSSLFDK